MVDGAPHDELRAIEGFPRLARLLRALALGTGVSLLLLAALTASDTFVLAAGGVALVLVGWFHRRFASSYGTAALLLANTVVCLALVELAATALLAVGTSPLARSIAARVTGRSNDVIGHYVALPFYQEQSWSAQHWREFRAALKKTYHPYVIWRSPAFSGETINIDAAGIRRTPGAQCGAASRQVFLFGGSAMWGWGSPDWGTIAAYLQQELSARHGGTVCVVNFAEQAFVSTQNLVQLVLELERGHVPDVVVFYDGVNEVLAASQSRRPILHQNYSEIAGLFDASRPVGLGVLESSRTVQLLRKAVLLLSGPTPGPATDGLETGPLVDAVVETYLANFRMVTTLAGEYGFERHFVWQPYILVGDKPLAADERRMIAGLGWMLDLNEDLRGMFAAIYARIERASRSAAGLHYVGDVFDAETAPLWIDTWGHTIPDANRIVARRIAEILETSAAPAPPS